MNLPYNTPRGTPRLQPVQTPGLSGVAAIDAGEGNFGLVALQVDGQTWWRWVPGEAPQRQTVAGSLAGVSAGYGLTLLLQTDARVLSYGFSGNGFGNLGDGTTTYRDLPAPVVDLPTTVTVASGTWHGLALDSVGRVWSWGLDSSGQLGRGRILGQSVPASVPGLSQIVRVSAGTSHNLAIDRAGSVWAWGSNGYGQLGDGTYADNPNAIRLTALADAIEVVAGAYYSLALLRDGSVWFWGGIPPGVTTQQPALPTRAMGDAQAISSANGHVLVLKRDGTVWAWGANGSGELGSGTQVASSQIQQVAGLVDIRQVVASVGSSYALGSDGRVWAWGGNWAGQLGDGTREQRLRPTLVAGLTEVVDIAAGDGHALARKRDGSVWGWGLSDAGALGDLAESSSTPVRLNTPSGVQQLAAGGRNSALLTADGLAYLAGNNTVGQLGDGTFARQPGFAISVNGTTDGLLDLAPGVPKQVAPGALPLFLVKTEQRGKLSALSLRANVFGLLNSTEVVRAARSGVVYNLYVVALVGSQTVSLWAVLNEQHNWQALSFPLAQYLSGVSLDARTQSVLVQILDSVDLSGLAGARIFVGYGIDGQEMLSSKRYREVLTIVP